MIDYTPNAATATPTIPIVEDGDEVDAINTGTMAQRLADMIALARPEIYSWAYDSDSEADADDLADDIPITNNTTSYVFGSASMSATLYVDVPGCVAGDIIVPTFTGPLTYSITKPTADVLFKLYAKEDQGGANTYRPIPGTRKLLHTVDMPTSGSAQIMSTGLWTIITPGICRVEFGIRLTTAVGNVGFHQSFGLTAQVFRKVT